jgi:hypothetical protein
MVSVNIYIFSDDCLFAILGLTVAGTGLNFVPCSCVIFAELSWTPGLLLQSEDRCHRIGSTASYIDVRYLIGSGTLDEYMLKLIRKKLSVIGETLDGEGKRAGNGLFDKNESCSRFVPGQKRLDVMFAKAISSSPDQKEKAPISNDVIVIDDDDEKQESLVVSEKLSVAVANDKPKKKGKKRKSDEGTSTSSEKPRKKAKIKTVEQGKINKTLDSYFQKK